jgi:putative PIG3 family NAD(P)H quinone oxidoreductase
MLAVLPEIDPSHPVPRLGEMPAPEPAPGEVLVVVRAAALNRADLLQLRGLYPPPVGESLVPGLECAGQIEALGDGVKGWRRGERVMALVASGGQAERAVVPEGQLMRLPKKLSFAEGAAIPEAGLTAWTNLVAEGGLQEGETVLVTGATGGMGTVAVQVARELGARVLAGVQTQEHQGQLEELGVDGFCLTGDGMADEVLHLTEGQGVDLVFDLVGGSLLPHSLAALKSRGRLVLIGLMAGASVEIDLSLVLRRRLKILGSVLRARSRAEKAELVAGFSDFALPRLKDGRLRPLVDQVFPFERVADAYVALAKGGAFGKVVVVMEPGAEPTG